MNDLAHARQLLRRADTRIGHRWWAPIGYLLVLLAASARTARRKLEEQS